MIRQSDNNIHVYVSTARIHTFLAVYDVFVLNLLDTFWEGKIYLLAVACFVLAFRNNGFPQIGSLYLLSK